MIWSDFGRSHKKFPSFTLITDYLMFLFFVQGNEVGTWTHRDKVLAHFESLELAKKEKVGSINNCLE